MRKWILHRLLVGMLGILAVSCSREADEPTMDGKAQVKFTIALDIPSAASRATWRDNYESAIGNDFDSRINLDQLFVNLTLNGQEYTVRNLLYWPTAEEDVYEFIGEVEGVVTAIEEATARIEVYANCTPGQETFTTDVAYLPMWGVQTATLSLAPDTRTDIGTIYLLRAMAKVEITMAAEGYTLESVTLNRYNTTGNYLPSGAANVANTTALHYDNEEGYCFNPNTTTEGTNLAFTVTDNHLVFYLPEVANADDGLKMALTLKKGTEAVTWIADPSLYFHDYADNTPFDVVRNHWYQYTITGVSDKVEVALHYQVMDWFSVDNPTLNFGNTSGTVINPTN